jgi:hypothetical protein
VVLEQLRQSPITITKCEATINRIRAAVSGELLKLPASLCDQLTGRNPEQIQRVLEMALRLALDRLAGPETYL